MIVENFVSAVCDLTDGSVFDYCDQFGRGSLFARSGGAVLVAHPRGFDWLCRSELSVYGRFVERVDTLLVVRTPPTAVEPAINAVRERVSKRPVGGLGDEQRAALLERVGSTAGERVRAGDGGAHATRLGDGLREAGFESLANDVADDADGIDVADSDGVDGKGETDASDGGPDRTAQ